MVMVADLLPGLKRFLRPLALKEARQQMMIRMIVAFVLHLGRMSCLQAAGVVRCDRRDRAQVGRSLGRGHWRKNNLNNSLRALVLAMESVRGHFVFLFDATLCSQQGRRTQNTYSTGNRKRRPSKGRRYGKNKHASKSCHSFTMGLLITPSGIRIPFCRPYRTREYCKKRGLLHRTTAEAAADLIRDLPLPEGAQVTVLGDTAYDAQVVREACEACGFPWIFPCNPERVLAGRKPRPKVRSLIQELSSGSLQPIRLSPGQGRYVAHRRLSAYRIGPKAKPRTYYVHKERRDVHSVGEVQLVFSTMKPNFKRATPDGVKILMTNDLRLTVREVVELYSLRWQIELFFKELKSTLGFHQYQFQKFECVEAWAEFALATMLYLEWYRAQQLARRDLSDEEKQWWRHQRAHGLCQAVRQVSQEAEMAYLAERLETPGGIRKMKRLIRNSFPKEYRRPA
jgi:DDE family transposase